MQTKTTFMQSIQMKKRDEYSLKVFAIYCKNANIPIKLVKLEVECRLLFLEIFNSLINIKRRQAFRSLNQELLKQARRILYVTCPNATAFHVIYTKQTEQKQNMRTESRMCGSILSLHYEASAILGIQKIKSKR